MAPTSEKTEQEIGCKLWPGNKALSVSNLLAIFQFRVQEVRLGTCHSILTSEKLNKPPKLTILRSVREVKLQVNHYTKNYSRRQVNKKWQPAREETHEKKLPQKLAPDRKTYSPKLANLWKLSVAKSDNYKVQGEPAGFVSFISKSCTRSSPWKSEKKSPPASVTGEQT